MKFQLSDRISLGTKGFLKAMRECIGTDGFYCTTCSKWVGQDHLCDLRTGAKKDMDNFIYRKGS